MGKSPLGCDGLGEVCVFLFVWCVCVFVLIFFLFFALLRLSLPLADTPRLVQTDLPRLNEFVLPSAGLTDITHKTGGVFLPLFQHALTLRPSDSLAPLSLCLRLSAL